MNTIVVDSVCRKCSKPFAAVAKYLKDKRHRCPTCHREYMQAYMRKYRATSGRHAEYFKQYYEKNRAKYISRHRVYRGHIRDEVNALKSGPCADCKTSYPPCVMDFDHVKPGKVCSIGYLLRTAPRDLILEEISKCELVCSNCHRLRTNKRMLAKNGSRHPVQLTRSTAGDIQQSC